MKKIIILAAVCAVLSVQAQTGWELGVGGSVMQFNRIKVVSVDPGRFDMKLRHAVFGGNIYAAHELGRRFALDFQGVVGAADSKPLVQAGVGLQWRLGSYFRSRYVDPYVRLGANYMYKGFDIYYTDRAGGLEWQMVNNMNKDGRDSRHLFALAAGVGTNMWLNDHLGIGLQADYLFVPRPSVANSLRGTARVMWRFGAPAEEVKPVAPVTLPARVERIVVRDTVYIEKQVAAESVYEIIQQIHFDFDKAEVRPEYALLVAWIADILKDDTAGRYLITGYTDARGAAEYNQHLSLLRAQNIAIALAECGVPREMLKVAGAGRRIANAPATSSERVREGDRKVTIERIDNPDYWEVL